MNRRQALLTPLAAAAPRLTAAPKAKLPPLQVKLGTQHTSDPAYLRILAALGVTHICSQLPSR